MRPCLLKKYRIAALMTVIVMVMTLAVFSCDDGDDDSDKKGAGGVPWPEWVFKHWVWQAGLDQDGVIQLVQDYTSHNIPVHAVIIDFPWETGVNTFQFNPVMFPDPKAMIDWLHDQDVRVLVWANPAINAFCEPGNTVCPEQDIYNEGLEKGYLMGDGILVPSWLGCPGGEFFCAGLPDLFNPEALDWWHGLLDNVLDLGIDGWKLDTIEPFSVMVSISPYAGPTEPWEFNDLYYTDFFEYTRSKLGPDRVIMARPVDLLNLSVLFGETMVLPFMNAPREVNFAGWLGQRSSDYNGIRETIYNMYQSSNVGYLSVGSDIGGSKVPAEELFIRWAQLGCMSPLMVNGGDGEHRPWMIGGDTLQTADIYRTYADLHYALITYLQQQAGKAWANGASLIEFQKNAGEIHTWEYLLGNDILVAPLYEAGDTRTVNFPAGDDWVYLWDRGQVYAGGTQAALAFPLAEYPVFLRKGSPVERDPNLP
jgi:alpha-glucosidase (family GH31 glycosyl hydrolase)